MAKKKTSRKQGLTSIEDLPIVKLKSSVKTKKLDPSKILKNEKFIYEALLECLKEGDKESFLEILAAHYKATNKTEEIEKRDIKKRTFYASLKPDANPSLETIMKLTKELSAS